MIGQIVGNYKIVRALGEGGVGMVYQGVDTMLDREVAIKVLRPELASQNNVVERFRTEAVTLAKLSHPNIATLYSLFRQGNDLFMILEFIKGETLDQILYRRRMIPTEEAIPIFCQALEGINYAHERGIVHRDIKPGNMMLTEEGILKVLDFGIARLLGTNRMTRIGNVIGTLEYMSPEQVRGLETDARSDVYGLGIMLYEMLTGKLPFESENDFELMKMQTEQMPQLPRTLNPSIPVEVEDAIIKAVAKNPDDRFQSAGDFLQRFWDLGYSLPNATFGFGTLNFKKQSRPSNPGIQNQETNSSITAPQIPQSQISTESMASIPKTEGVGALEPSEEAKAHSAGETRVATPVRQNELKETRLGNSVSTNPNEIKATQVRTIHNNEVQSSPSFLSKLTWVHYAGASAVLMGIFGLAGMVIVLPLIFGDNGPKVTQQPQNVKQVQQSETPKLQNPTPMMPSTPESVSQPKGDSFSSQPIQQNPSSTPFAVEPVGSGNPPQDSPRQRETVKNNPPPQQQQPKKTSPPPAPKQKEPADNGGSKKDLRKILTDN